MRLLTPERRRNTPEVTLQAARVWLRATCMPPILHNPPPHLCNYPIPITQRSLIHVIRFLTWIISLTPPSRARLSYTLNPALFTFQRCQYLFRIFDPFSKGDNLATSIRSFDDANRGILERFCIRVVRKCCEGGSGAVRIEGLDQGVRCQSGPLNCGEVGDILWESYGYCVRGLDWCRGRMGNCWSRRLGHSWGSSRLSRRTQGTTPGHEATSCC